MEVNNYIAVIHVILSVILCQNNANTVRFDRGNRLVSYSIPEARELKKALGYTEDTYLNFTELTSKHGYQAEQHTLTTEDGYILTAFRILPKCNGATKLYPVVLVHGIFDSSDMWIAPGLDLGLGYILSNNCYDVWAINHRGNAYSRQHRTLDPDKDLEYWEYTFDEHGNFDIPAFIDYVLQVTNKRKVFYAGHSQGTTDFFVTTSLRPEYNQKVQLSIQLGPVAWMNNIFSPIPRLLAPSAAELKALLDAAGYREILSKRHLSHLIAELLCQFAPEETCGTTLSIATGYEQGTIESKTLSVAFGHLIAGTSSKNVLHFAQLIVSPKFKRFDEGIKGNLKRYGSRRPPEYNVSRIFSPVVLISAQNDWLSSLKDVETLSARLPNLLENYVVPVKKWSHHNHLWDVRARKYVLPKILDYFERYNV